MTPRHVAGAVAILIGGGLLLLSTAAEARPSDAELSPLCLGGIEPMRASQWEMCRKTPNRNCPEPGVAKLGEATVRGGDDLFLVRLAFTDGAGAWLAKCVVDGGKLGLKELTKATLSPVTATAGGGCKTGFVWREAVDGDHVCVVAANKEAAAVDNREVFVRRSPKGGPYGPDTCRAGFVWREANPSDHACVTPQARQQVRDDNAAAGGRVEPIAAAAAPVEPATAPAERSPDDLVKICRDAAQQAQQRQFKMCNDFHRPNCQEPVTPEVRGTPTIRGGQDFYLVRLELDSGGRASKMSCHIDLGKALDSIGW